MASEGKVGIGDPDVKSSSRDFKKDPVRRIKFEKAGDSYRLAFLSDEVAMRMRHYVKGPNYRRCLAYQGFCPACVSPDVKSATEAFGANVFVFKTKGNNMVDDPDCLDIIDPVSGDINLFIFGSEKFVALRSIKKRYGSLVGIDIEVTCTTPDFQKCNFTAFPKESSMAAKPEVMAMMQAKAKKDSYPVEKMIAKEVSPSQMVKDYSLNPSLLDACKKAEATIQDKVPPSTEGTKKTTKDIPTQAQEEIPLPEEPIITDADDILEQL